MNGVYRLNHTLLLWSGLFRLSLLHHFLLEENTEANIASFNNGLPPDLLPLLQLTLSILL